MEVKTKSKQKEVLNIEPLDSCPMDKRERDRVIKRVEVFYSHFQKHNMFYYKKDIISLWIRTELALRKMFKYELGEKCKGCTHCCCDLIK